VGSGTKMALEDAVALAAALAEHGDDLPAALAGYEAAARPSVEAIQNAARPSLGWWEHFGRYHDAFEPWQFAYHFLSRSITDARLARRAPDFVKTSHERWCAAHGAEPLDTPLNLAGRLLPGRSLVVEVDGDAALARPTVGDPLQLLTVPGAEHWGAWIEAPQEESDLAAAHDALAALVEAGPVLVAVHGGTAHTRTLLAEQVRLYYGLPSLLVDDELDHDRAITAVLSGRADLVGARAATVSSWKVPA
jgi:hypothetical protein